MSGGLTPEGCLLCGESRHQPLFRYREPDAYERAVGVTADAYAREWVSCSECRFHYARYSRDPDILDQIYNDAYRDTVASWRQHSAEDVFRRIVALPVEESETLTRCRSIKFALGQFAEWGVHAMPERSPLRLLDVGGATGAFAHLFRDDEWHAEIVDPSAHGRFVEKHGVPYHQNRFDAAFRGGAYELVSMIYMLEHVRDPIAVLGKAHEVLGNGGLLYIEVPDEIAFERKPPEDDIFNSCHLWMFGPASLTRLLSCSGFDPLDISRFRALRGHYALAVLARPI